MVLLWWCWDELCVSFDMSIAVGLLSCVMSEVLWQQISVVLHCLWVDAFGFIVVVFFVCHTPRPEHSLWEGDIVWATIVSRFMGRFWCSCQCFFKKVIALSEWRHSSFFRCWTAPQFSGNCGQNCEKFKNRRKSLCAPLRIDIWKISKKSIAVL